MSDFVAHVLGRFYLCPNDHETDDVEVEGEITEAFLNDPPDEKPCAECSAIAKLKFYGAQHHKSEPCDRPSCGQLKSSVVPTE